MSSRRRICALTLLLVICISPLLSKLGDDAFADMTRLSDMAMKAMFLSDKPSVEDIEATKDEEKITIPEDDEFYDEYNFGYIKAPGESGTYVYQDPCTDYLSRQGTVSHGSFVAILAERDDYYYLIRYFNRNDEARTGWIPKKVFSEEFPSSTGIEYDDYYDYWNNNYNSYYRYYNYYYEKSDPYNYYPNGASGYWKRNDVVGELSDDVFPGTNVRILNLPNRSSNPNQKFFSITAKYKITDKNGIENPEGMYELWAYDGNEWNILSKFEIADADAEVTVKVNLDEAILMKSIAIVPCDESRQGCDFELYVTDILI